MKLKDDINCTTTRLKKIFLQKLTNSCEWKINDNLKSIGDNIEARIKSKVIPRARLLFSLFLFLISVNRRGNIFLVKWVFIIQVVIEIYENSLHDAYFLLY